MAEPRTFRPARSDDLGLRRALSDRLLPLLVAAMAFLAALALAGLVAADSLGRHWRGGAGSSLTVQVPDPADVPRILPVLADTPGVADARALSTAEVGALLRPWLGGTDGRIALPLPGVVAVRVGTPGPDESALATRLAAVAPGASVDSNGFWLQRLAVLLRSLQACAVLAVGLVAAVAVLVVMVATRAGLAARRTAIEIVHGLGGTDGFIAGRFAARTMRLAAVGGVAGALLALPVLLRLAGLAAPFAGGTVPDDLQSVAATVPWGLWAGLPALPLAAAAIGWVTAQMTVRRWLRRLP